MSEQLIQEAEDRAAKSTASGDQQLDDLNRADLVNGHRVRSKFVP